MNLMRLGMLFGVLGLGNWALAQTDLPVLHNPLTAMPQQQFTMQEQQSLNSLIRSLNSRRTPKIDQLLLGKDWCGPIRSEDAILSFVAPFRNNKPERLEVVLVCGGERNAVTLTLTQAGKRTTYLLPPEQGGGGIWGISSAYTVRDINQDGRRELALVHYGGGDMGSASSLTLLTFDEKGPNLLGKFDVRDETHLSKQDGGYSGIAGVLRVQKGHIPIVYTKEYELEPDGKTWKPNGQIRRTALLSNPIHFVVWP